AESRAVAEVLLNDFGHEIDCDVDGVNPMADEMEHDALEHRAAGDFQHRLRDTFSHRAQPRAFSARHYNGHVQLGRSPDQVAQEVDADEAPVAIEDGHMLERASFHQIEHRNTISFGAD